MLRLSWFSMFAKPLKKYGDHDVLFSRCPILTGTWKSVTPPFVKGAPRIQILKFHVK